MYTKVADVMKEANSKDGLDVEKMTNGLKGLGIDLGSFILMQVDGNPFEKNKAQDNEEK